MGLNKKDLKNLSRSDLLELLLAQTERVEALEVECTELKNQVDTKDIMIGKSGTLAEAAMAINRVFQAADQAAAQYLGNVMRIYDEQVEKNARLEREYRQKLAMILDSAEERESPELEIESESEIPTPSEEDTVIPTEEEPVQESTEAEQETKANCEAMLREATEQCNAMRREAEKKCTIMLEETRLKCSEEEEKVRLECEALKTKTLKEIDEYNKKYKAFKEKVEKYIEEHKQLKPLW